MQVEKHKMSQKQGQSDYFALFCGFSCQILVVKLCLPRSSERAHLGP